MAYLYLRGNVWWVSWKPPEKRRQRRSTDCTIAEKVAAEETCARLTLLEKQARQPLLPKIQTFRQVLQDFLAAKRVETEARTLRGYQTHARNFLDDHDPPAGVRLASHEPFESITAADIRRYMLARVEAGVSKQTANKERVTLLILWNWAQKNEVTERNPVRATKPFRVRGRARRQPYPADRLQELVAVLRAEAREPGKRPATKHDLELIADLGETFYHTGWRLGESCALLAAEVDLEAGVAAINSALNKGAESAFPIPAEVRPIIARRLALGGRHVFGAFPRLGKDGERLDDHAYRAVELFWRRWVKTHPEWKGAPFHRLRHTYTTEAAKAGIKGLAAQALTRHRSGQAHEIYQHARVEEIRAAQEQLATWRRLELERAKARRSDPRAP